MTKHIEFNGWDDVIDRRLDSIAILGGGRTVWDDWERLTELYSHFTVMAVNDIAIQFKGDKVTHGVSLHSEWLKTMKAKLPDIETHCSKEAEGVDYAWHWTPLDGTSSMFALRIALMMGYKHIVLCGVPLDNNGHYFDPPDKPIHKDKFFNLKHIFRPWEELNKALPNKLNRCVRAMSGRTQSIFGHPTKEWYEIR